jgi:predicted metal-dependent hydrolase
MQTEKSLPINLTVFLQNSSTNEIRVYQMTAPMIDSVIRSRRKTIALVITAEAKLIVRAPMKTPLAYIKSLVERKGNWIQRKQEELRNTHRVPKKMYTEGEAFSFLGETYRLAVADNMPSAIELKDTLTIDKKALPAAREMISAWYKDQALRVFRERCAFFAVQTGLRPQAVKLTNALTRWGSCSPRGTVRINWKLIMAPLEIIDYLIVHELAHLKHRNHSCQYWETVERILPDYRMHRKWLRDNRQIFFV